MGISSNESQAYAESDANLAIRALQGDQTAFTELVSRHKRRAYGWIRRYVDNRSDADDVLQDTFLAAWRGLSGYQTDRPLEFWLRQIAVNKCRDRVRRETIRRSVDGRWDGNERSESSDAASAPHALLEEQEAFARLQACLRELPDALGKPLQLTAIEGMSHKEAGRVLGVSPKAVEVKVYRARIRLMQLLGTLRSV